MSITGYPTWVQQVLQKAGYPITPVNQQALYLWALSEQPPTQWAQTHNYLDVESSYGQPLSSTNLGFGPGLWNPQGVVMFADQDGGTSATAQLLQQKPGIDAAFKSGKSLKAIFGAIQLSTFCCDVAPSGGPGDCATCSGSQYPPRLYGVLGMTGTQVAAYVKSLVGSPFDEQSPSAGVGGSKNVGVPQTSGSGCGTQPGWDLRVFTISACNLKAMKGGALCVAGALVMGLGVFIFVQGVGGKSVTADQLRDVIGRAPKAAAEEVAPEATPAQNRSALRREARTNRAALRGEARSNREEPIDQADYNQRRQVARTQRPNTRQRQRSYEKRTQRTSEQNEADTTVGGKYEAY